MKRKIKFRFWDNETKSFEYWDMSWGTNKLPVMTEFSDAINQFTALHDKNGKEIYEGDLIETTDEWYDGDMIMKGFIGEVIFKDGSFCVKGSREYDYIPLDEVCINNYDLKVIGNIYENKDLL